MKNNILLTLIIFPFSFVFAQNLTLQTTLSGVVNETSGLLYINGQLFTVNDSGNTASIYQIDENTGNIIRSIPVNNATNIDWEAITADHNYVYIGDFGNNYGDRTDLKIYRIPINDVLNNRSVNADVIHFSYANQTDFSSQQGTTNFDAESLIAYNNHLYIFTKNWGDAYTNIYELSNTPGTFSAQQIDSFNAQGLITDATYTTQNQSVILTGYTYSETFVVKLSGFTNHLFSNGQIERVSVQVPSGYSDQIEGISYISPQNYYISAEARNNPGGLYHFNTTGILSTSLAEQTQIKVFPNPAVSSIIIDAAFNTEVLIYDISGKVLLKKQGKYIDIKQLSKGIYLLKIMNRKQQYIYQTKLIIE